MNIRKMNPTEYDLRKIIPHYTEQKRLLKRSAQSFFIGLNVV